MVDVAGCRFPPTNASTRLYNVICRMQTCLCPLACDLSRVQCRPITQAAGRPPSARAECAQPHSLLRISSSCMKAVESQSVINVWSGIKAACRTISHGLFHGTAAQASGAAHGAGAHRLRSTVAYGIWYRHVPPPHLATPEFAHPPTFCTPWQC